MERLHLDHYCYADEINLETLAARIIYSYLFDHLSLREIEKRSLNTLDFNGFMAKSILNFYGIDCAKHSRDQGIYKNEAVKDVALLLLKSEDPQKNRIGKLFLDHIVQL